MRARHAPHQWGASALASRSPATGSRYHEDALVLEPTADHSPLLQLSCVARYVGALLAALA